MSSEFVGQLFVGGAWRGTKPWPINFGNTPLKRTDGSDREWIVIRPPSFTAPTHRTLAGDQLAEELIKRIAH